MNPTNECVHSACWMICVLCSKHPAVTTGRGKNGNIYTSEPARPPHPYRLDNHLSSDNSKKPIAWKKIQRISLFHAIHQDCISDNVNTVSECVHLIYWVLKQVIANWKIASLQTLMDRIGHNDRLCDHRHNSSVAVKQVCFADLRIFK